MTTRLIDEKPCPVCTTGSYPSFGFGNQLCEKHDVCITCGCKRQGLGYAPWGVRYGAFQCKPCEAAEREAGIKARITKGFSHEYTDEVICPYCGYEHGDSWEMRDGEHDCPDCEKPFTVSRNVSVSYNTEKKESKA